jgi:hypothetical protein
VTRIRHLLRGLAPVVVTTALLATAGCNQNAPTTTPTVAGSGATGSPTASASASTRPSTSSTSEAPDLIEFSVDGAGPYVLGRTLTQLQTNPGLGSVEDSASCPGNKQARGQGVWQDVTLQFHSDGKLYLAVNHSASIPTPSGAWLGTTLADLKKIYASVSNEQLNKDGKNALLVRTLSGQGILFVLNDDPTKTVESMVVASGNYLRTQFTTGGAYC